jgi:hypothetical protein
MNQSDKSKEQQEQIARNLGKLFQGIDPQGKKPMPKPSPAPAPFPAKKGLNGLTANHFIFNELESPLG